MEEQNKVNVFNPNFRKKKLLFTKGRCISFNVAKSFIRVFQEEINFKNGFDLKEKIKKNVSKESIFFLNMRCVPFSLEKTNVCL